MHTHGQKTTIDQKIFNMGLSTETISIYLLCCGLVDAGSPISTNRLSAVWNSTSKAFREGLSELEAKNILGKILSDGEDNNVYQIRDAQKWMKP